MYRAWHIPREFAIRVTIKWLSEIVPKLQFHPSLWILLTKRSCLRLNYEFNWRSFLLTKSMRRFSQHLRLLSVCRLSLVNISNNTHRVVNSTFCYNGKCIHQSLADTNHSRQIGWRILLDMREPKKLGWELYRSGWETPSHTDIFASPHQSTSIGSNVDNEKIRGREDIAM